MNPLREIENVLKSSIGMDVGSVGATSTERAVERRMRAVGISSQVEYLSKLHTDSIEVQELIECVVVPETWFFRGKETFAAMLELAHEIAVKIGAARPLRVLSVPSSTGEEPYSIVMALLDGGFDPSVIEVEAVDVSVSALEKAAVGTYGTNSFRGNDLRFRERHFTKVKLGWQLSRAVMDNVRFRRRNVVAHDFLTDCAPFHFIFCRNLLIYLDRETQSGLVDRLSELLLPGGHLFLGSGEAIAISEKPFANSGYSMAFAYRKQPTQLARSPTNKQQSTRPLRLSKRPTDNVPANPKSVKRAARSPSGGSSSVNPVSPAPLRSASPDPPLLEQARVLADSGQLSEAASACERIIAKGSSSADTLYLLGVVRDAQGDLGEAAECYRKAIYLDPTHTDAMLHLAHLRDGQGDSDSAANLRARARRIDSGLRVKQ